MIKINEELATKIGYKNLRGLKMGISRRFGKGTYNENLEVDKDVIIFLASRKNKYEVFEEYINDIKDDNTVTTEEQLEMEGIYNIAVERVEEIITRQGEFYHYGYELFDLNDISSMVVSMHLNHELTLEQMQQMAQKHRLDIPIVYTDDKDRLDEYYKQLEQISNSYRQYTNQGNHVFDVVESSELSYGDIVECEYLDDEVERQTWKDKQSKLKSTQGDITVIVGYDTNSSEQLCIYNNKVLIGHYSIDVEGHNDWTKLENRIAKLFEMDKIENIDIGQMLNIIKTNIHENYKVKEQDEYYSNVDVAKYEYKENNLTFLVISKPFVNHGDKIQVYDVFTLVGEVVLESAVLGDNDFTMQVSMNDELEKLLDKVGATNKFRVDLLAYHMDKVNKRKQQEQKQQQQYKSYSSNDYSHLIGSTSNHDEEKCKQAYKVLSKAFHPDLEGGSTEMMQFVNSLKTEWNI